MVSVTGTYISTTDMVNLFGESNITTWADLENNGDTDVMTARLTEAIEFGEGSVEDAFRQSRVTVPFTVTGNSLTVLKTFMVAYAVSWLRNSRPLSLKTTYGEETDHVSVMLESLNTLMWEYQSGRRIFEGAVGNIDDEAVIGIV